MKAILRNDKNFLKSLGTAVFYHAEMLHTLGVILGYFIKTHKLFICFNLTHNRYKIVNLASFYR